MKIKFLTPFPSFAYSEGLSDNTFPKKKVIKTRQKLLWSFSDDAIRQQSLAVVSAQAIQYTSKTYCKNLEHIQSQTWKANNLLFVWNSNNLSIQVKLGPEIPFSLILRTVLMKWHNVCPNLYRQYKMQTVDCCKPQFYHANDNVTTIVPLFSNPENNSLQSAVCTLRQFIR